MAMARTRQRRSCQRSLEDCINDRCSAGRAGGADQRGRVLGSGVASPKRGIAAFGNDPRHRRDHGNGDSCILDGHRSVPVDVPVRGQAWVTPKLNGTGSKVPARRILPRVIAITARLWSLAQPAWYTGPGSSRRSYRGSIRCWRVDRPAWTCGAPVCPQGLITTTTDVAVWRCGHMRVLTLLAIVFASSWAQAKPQAEWTRTCDSVGHFAELVSTARDERHPADQASSRTATA